ncbi:MAG: GNAT family N-acetyltransferase [Planctomycetota bacterium]
MKADDIEIRDGDPQGEPAGKLLREAAIEARAQYPELFAADDPWPTNPPVSVRGAFVLAYHEQVAVGCASLRSLSQTAVELRRVFVALNARRQGVAQALLDDLENRAQQMGYTHVLLETGFRQLPAMAFYEARGYFRIQPFGEYRDDPSSVCFEKKLSHSSS